MWTTYRKLWDLFDPKGRLSVLALFLLMLAAALIEAFAVAAVLPLVASVMGHGGGAQASWAATLIGAGSGGLGLQASIFCLIVILAIVLKVLAEYASVRFSWTQNVAWSHQLLRAYMNRDYDWFLTRHSAEVGYGLLGRVQEVVSGSLLPGLRLIVNLLVTVFIIGVLLHSMSSLILFGVAGIVALYGGIFFSLRKRLSMLGTEREQVAALRHRLVGEIFGGIKEVKLHGLEAIYEGLTHQPFHRYAVLQSQRHLFSILPRYMFEAIGFVGLFLLVPVLRKAGGSVGAALPMLGMIGFAGYRLLPAIQQIYLNAVSLPIGRQALSTLHSELVGVDCGLPVEQAPLELRREIALRGATYAYPGAERMSIDHLDLRIEARTTVALVGRSGAGKSTLADLTIGLLVPTTGDLAIDGVELDAAGRRAWRANCAYVPQHVFLLDDTIAANIAFGVPAHLFDMQRIEAAARAAALHEFVSTTLPQGYATRIGERGVRLSGGQRQRIGIARALYRDAGYLVMDEATNALDPGTEAEVMLALDRLKGTHTVLVIAHRLSTVERCDRVLLIDGGRIVADGSYQDLLRDSSEFRRFANAGDIDDAMPLVPV